MAKKTRVFIAGIDTLIVNVKRTQGQMAVVSDEENEDLSPEQGLADGVMEQLECWFIQAKNANEPFVTSWVHEGITLKIFPHGTTTHHYLLKSHLIDLMIGPQLNNNAPARVRFSSEYLWKYGVDVALVNTHAFLMEKFDEHFHLQPAELHLCVDMTGLVIPKDYERVFVSRSVVRRPVKESQIDKPVYRHHRLETLQFSGHASAISATIYDKIAEIKQKSHTKVWFHDLWRKKGWDGESPVWRIECRIKRKALHEMDIEETYDAIEKVPGLWAYCVGHADDKNGWLRMVSPNIKDKNRWRWETSEAWLEVQKAFSQGWRGYEDMADIQRERKRQVNLDRAEKAIAGYTTTYAAWLQDEIGPDDDASIVVHRLYNRMQKIWEDKGADFHDLRLKKQYVYNIS